MLCLKLFPARLRHIDVRLPTVLPWSPLRVSPFPLNLVLNCTICFSADGEKLVDSVQIVFILQEAANTSARQKRHVDLLWQTHFRLRTKRRLLEQGDGLPASDPANSRTSSKNAPAKVISERYRQCIDELDHSIRFITSSRDIRPKILGVKIEFGVFLGYTTTVLVSVSTILIRYFSEPAVKENILPKGDILHGICSANHTMHGKTNGTRSFFEELMAFAR